MELKNRTLIILSVILVILLGFIIFLNTNKITSRSYELSGLSKGQTVYAYDIKDNEVIQSVYSMHQALIVLLHFGQNRYTLTVYQIIVFLKQNKNTTLLQIIWQNES